MPPRLTETSVRIEQQKSYQENARQCQSHIARKHAKKLRDLTLHDKGAEVAMVKTGVGYEPNPEDHEGNRHSGAQDDTTSSIPYHKIFNYRVKIKPLIYIKLAKLGGRQHWLL